MEALVLDTAFKKAGIVDDFESFIWTERYFSCGDFELTFRADQQVLGFLKKGYYLLNRESDWTMMVETIQLVTDVENGDRIIVKGRSVEALPDWRIILTRKLFRNDNLQSSIKVLLDENVIIPTEALRAIPNFSFQASTDARITVKTIDAQYLGENIYEVIQKLCLDSGMGFRVRFTDTNQFVFSLYMGIDRSYNQSANPRVVFSPANGNLFSSNYISSDVTLRTSILIGGEGEDTAKVLTGYNTTTPSLVGLARREIFAESGLAKTVNGELLSTTAYDRQLKQFGREELTKHVSISAFDAEVDASRVAVYGRDFFMGDIVQIENAYGLTGTSRVVEVIRSHEATGETVIPTFQAI